ncbi:E3 ubiquitin-protein ligase SGR9, amyloplastic-like [Nicotiana tabacum]|uniref:RING-type E3 ubiquitin transferase n=1 Tax=Nicotiana tabacum TaxID=4097 RepID=A0A1S4BX11_TOBAC|nr:PREDICTED: E3 ubiquitin-protein ligase SGR9, amyloplastic-like [Nicotiana tabacum]
MKDQRPLESIIMSALSTFTPPQLSDLTLYFSALYHRHHRRIFSLLSSPTLFSLTLHHLHSLSLHHKSLLIAKHLLFKLAIFTHFMHNNTILPPPSTASMKLRDLDAVLLLLLLCELRQHDPEALDLPPSRWRLVLCQYIAKDALKLSSIRGSNREVIMKFIEMVAKCKNFINAMNDTDGNGGKDRKEVATSVAIVVALPSVEVSGGRGRECVICKEEMKEERDVCKLPCHHLFHWICVLPWLKTRNTCPCCRFQLPSDDVFAEIRRLWEIVVKTSDSAKFVGVV